MLSPKNNKTIKIISFDVFDTLVARMVSDPSDVFKIMQSRLANATSEMRDYASDFISKRIQAEENARRRDCAEVTLKDIYQEFLAMQEASSVTIEQLMALEVQTELDVCVARPDGKKLFDEAHSNGFPIVIASDMYLPEIAIARILKQCGYIDWIRCFVSSEYGATKRDGALFDILVSTLNVKPNEILHIGDNLHSDCIMPKRRGLHCKWVYNSSVRYGSLEESFLASANKLAVEAAKENRDVDVELFGYRDFGPIIAGFCDWLNAQLLEEGIEKVFYFARDGLLVQRAMKQLGYCEFKDHYLYVSRRALQVPSYANINSFRDLVESMYLPERTTLLHILKKSGVSVESIELALRKVEFDPKETVQVSEIELDDRAVLAFEYLKDEIRANAKRECALLVSYLKQIDFSGRVAIVDIGWFGNMQVALEKVCSMSGINAEIHGYYVGLNPDGRNQSSHDMKGYLFDSSHGRDRFDCERRYNTIFEILFSATHGTTRGYEELNGVIHPILANYEGAERATGEKAEAARRGALRFVEDWARILPAERCLLPSKEVMRGMDRLGISPSTKEACFFGDWTMEDDGRIVSVAKPRSASDYVCHPSLFLRDLGPTHWKIGFLKRLFRIPLPYGKLLIAAMKPLELFGIVHGPSSCRNERKTLRSLFRRNNIS